MAQPTILVLDGDQRAALAVVRSLGRRGCPVAVGAPAERSLAGTSRFAAERIPLPDPLLAPDRFGHSVVQAARQTRADVVVPITEASALALLPERSALAPAVIPLPPALTFSRACDKVGLMETAAQVGLSVPAHHLATTSADLVALKDKIPYPVVLKPARSVAGTSGQRRKTAVRWAKDPDALRDLAASSDPGDYPMMLQERVDGPGVGVFMLRWNDRVLASFAHRRLLEHPPAGGVSACSESIPLDPDLACKTAALLAALDWEGVAMVEFKVCVATKRPFLMEINGRFWGSLQLAIDAGVDFPWLLIQAATNQTVQPVDHWRIGIRNYWWWGVVDHLLARVRHRSGSPPLSATTPSIPWVIGALAAAWRPGAHNEIFKLRDPRPFLTETTGWLSALRRSRR